MAIIQIEIGVPSKRVSNEQIVSLVLENSLNSELSEHQLKSEIYKFLDKSGAKYRFWREHGELPRNILDSVILRCFSKVDTSEIDVIIFCSATKYVAEPAHAAFIAQEYGLRPKISFDVSDGCMGWITAIQLINTLSHTKNYHIGMLISHEFPMGDQGAIYPSAYKIKNSHKGF